MKSKEEILRQHLHGYSDKQFANEIATFPLCEALFAMEEYAAQQQPQWVPVSERLFSKSEVLTIVISLLNKAATNATTCTNTKSDGYECWDIEVVNQYSITEVVKDIDSVINELPTPPVNR